MPSSLLLVWWWQRLAPRRVSGETGSGSGSTSSSRAGTPTGSGDQADEDDEDGDGPRRPARPGRSPPEARVVAAVRPGASPTPSMRSSVAAGDEEADHELFRCPWPGCLKVFDRVKSRSAHLKWHGGNYRADDQPGTPPPPPPPPPPEPAAEPAVEPEPLQRESRKRKRGRPARTSEAVGPAAATKRARVSDEASEAAPIDASPARYAPGATVTLVSSRTTSTTAALVGRIGTVQEVAAASPEPLYSVTVPSTKGGDPRTVMVPESGLAPGPDEPAAGDTASPSSMQATSPETQAPPEPTAPGDTVLVCCSDTAPHDPSPRRIFVRRCEVLAVRGHPASLLEFQVNLDDDGPRWVPADATLPDLELAHKKMKVGMRVCTFALERSDQVSRVEEEEEEEEEEGEEEEEAEGEEEEQEEEEGEEEGKNGRALAL